MPKKGVEKRHSETALFAALYRAVANKEFKNERLGPDYLAEYFLPSHFKFLIKFKKIRVNVKNKSNKLTPGIYEYTLARTAFFDNVFIDAYSDEFGHLFRGISATCSEDNRPPVPRQIGHLVGAKRRWYFIISQSLFC